MIIRTPIGKYDADILMSRTGLCKKPVRRTTRRIVLDGVIYPSYAAAAVSIDAKPNALRTALYKGRKDFQGHEVSYCEE